jgi:hypothetical protein
MGRMPPKRDSHGPKERGRIVGDDLPIDWREFGEYIKVVRNLSTTFCNNDEKGS